MELTWPRPVDDLVVVANTRHGPRAHARAEGDTGATHDHLRDPADARRFLAARMGIPDGLPSRADLAAFRKLREAVEQVVDERAPFPQKVVQPLLRKAAFRLDDRGDLVPEKSGWAGLAHVLLLSLRDFSEIDRPLKRCNNAACKWLFVDRSRNQTRQWCEMGMCGNRAKVARFKRRQQPTAAA
ncbi:MAG TPA: CGNR zinc finger domain-containing protein [Mycobacterium sp.]|nr:CGNR zinc finger domain-containing protein [Mycobacterium sp.]